MSHSQRQTEILQELGLTPRWNLKQEWATATPIRSTKQELVATDVPPPQVSINWSSLEMAVRDCTACSLAESRTQTVFGSGARQGDVLIIGEAPGAEEDRLGEPFVGQAGKLLDNMLKAIGESRQSAVFIANVLKCRPPGNRDPQAHEIQSCAHFLKQQIALLQPRLIIVVGRIAAQALLNTESGIGQLRGKLHSYEGTPLLVTYHPAYLLRSPQEKAKAWADLLLIQQQLKTLRNHHP